MGELTFTPIDEIDKIRATLKGGFQSGKLKSIAYRKTQLLQLAYLLKDNLKRFQDALKSDLGRPELEANFLELNSAIGEVMQSYNGVAKWTKPESPPFSITFAAMKPLVRKEPKGTVVIIGPFNMPIWLTISPLAGAIAAGNTILLKPSELSPACSALFAELIPQYIDRDVVQVVNGGVSETTRLLELQWDHILYTGSTAVAKIVSAAAAKHLTPVSLELGGKSPAVIDSNCDLKTTANRLLWGKMANAGQICVSPDYVLVPRTFQDQLVNALKETYDRFYPEGPATSESFSRMVSSRHFARVKALLDNTKGTIVAGAEYNQHTKYIAPTIVKDVELDDSLMSEEIFGPVLPIVPVDDVDEAIKIINSREDPLTLYVFSSVAAFKNKVFDNTRSGSCVANDCVIIAGADGLPFGGTGGSGYGYHTGKYSFDMFTHLRASIDSPSWVDTLMGVRFPPYTASKNKGVHRLISTSLPPRPSKHAVTQNGSTKWWGMVSLALVLGVALAWQQNLRIYWAN